MAEPPVTANGDVPAKWVTSISLSLICVLIVIPLYDNVQQQRVMTALLRERNTNGFALRRLSFNWTNPKTAARHPWILGLEGYNTHSWFLYNDDETTVSSTKTENPQQDNTHATSPPPQHPDSLLPPPILATDISPYEHLRFIQATNEQGVKLSTLSSVDYVGCCGGVEVLLANMANAAWIASRFEFALHTWWGHCGNDTEVFQHLFGPPHREHLQNVTSTNKYIRIQNQIPGTDNLQRKGKGSDECWCQKEQIAAHEEFYQNLRNRFRYKKQVDDFRQRHFHNHMVLGMHIRAVDNGGEHGDNVRFIANVTDWVQQASQRIAEVTKKDKWKKSPLLYITTDTPSLVDLFRSELKGIMPVIESPLEHSKKANGVSSGDSRKTQDLQCIRGWENKVMDMIILSHVDMLIAGRMSSLEQTMPMSLVFAKQAVKTPKCELNHDATKLTCSKTYMDWCCHVSARKLRPANAYQRGEAIMVAHPDHELDLKRFKVKDRSKDNASSLMTHLPYYWKTRAMLTTKNI